MAFIAISFLKCRIKIAPAVRAGLILPSQCQRSLQSSSNAGEPGSNLIVRFRRHSVLRVRAKAGGARRDRTDDLMLAKHALSQLSYGPFVERHLLGLLASLAGRQLL